MLSGEEVELLSTVQNYEINSIIVVNALGDLMEVDLMNVNVPEKISLKQNYPNPFNPTTMIGFTLAENELISLNIFDIKGRLVKTLIDNEQLSNGDYQIIWNGKNNFEEYMPSGMYLYKLKSKNHLKMKKMILMK